MTTTHPSEADTINLNRLIRRVLRGGLIVGLVTAAVAAAVWVASPLMEPEYEAKALIQITEPPIYPAFVMSLIGARPLDPDPKVLSLLVKSEAVTDEVFTSSAMQAYRGPAGRFNYPRSLMRCNAIGKSSLQLAVRGDDPQLVATLANAWAEVAVEHIRREYGISEQTIAMLGERAEAALAHWRQLDDQLRGVPSDDFAADRLHADIEVARNMYLALTQAAAQARVSRTTAGDAISLASPARPPANPLRPRPKRYAIVAALLTFSVGIFLVLVVELARLDR